MRLVTDYAPLERRTERGFEAAAEDTLNDARQSAPRLSGEYAASLARSRTGADSEHRRVRIGSPLPQAGAIERGANVGPRRGPHMRPVGTLREAGARYVHHMTRRLREAGP